MELYYKHVCLQYFKAIEDIFFISSDNTNDYN